MALLGGNLQSKLLLLIFNNLKVKTPPLLSRYSTNPSSSSQNPSFPSSSLSISHPHHSRHPTFATPPAIEQLEPDREDEDDPHLLLPATQIQQDAEKAAVAAIAARAITAAELHNKLAAKGFAPNVIAKVLHSMQSKGYINDYSYAQAYSQSRWSSSTWGPKRIIQSLQRKGVSQADANKATQHVFLGDDGGSPDIVLGMSKSAMDRLFLQASKQWIKSQSVTHDKRKARLVRWLQYRGFSWPVIAFILNKLESHSTP